MTVDQLIKELLRLKERQGGQGKVVIATARGPYVPIDDLVVRLNDVALEPRTPLERPQVAE